MHHSSARTRRLFRAAFSLLLALCLVVQPVLGAIGELHEADAHAATAAMHLDPDTLHPDLATAGASGHDDGDMRHQLLHFAHCCGQSASHAHPDMRTLLLAIEVAATSTRDLRPPARDPHLGVPFRPPIQA